MRLISCSMTEPQIRDGIKSVPGDGAQRFVAMFCRARACRPDRVIRVLRFRYLSIDDLTKKQRDQWLRLVERTKEVEQ